jgi:hypothetical protein
MNNFRLLLCMAGMIIYLVLWHFLGDPANPPDSAPAKPKNSVTDGDKLELIREPDQVVNASDSTGPG